MTAREKTDWLIKTNPYEQRYLWDAWREGARAFWTETMPEWRGNSRERAAFTKGYEAARIWDRRDLPPDPGYYIPCGQTDSV